MARKPVAARGHESSQVKSQTSVKLGNEITASSGSGGGVSKDDGTTFRMPNLANATAQGCVDELGLIRDKIKVLTKLEGVYKDALNARLEEGMITVQGDVYAAIIAQETQFRIDTARVKMEMGEEWYQDHCKEISFRKITTKKLPK